MSKRIPAREGEGKTARGSDKQTGKSNTKTSPAAKKKAGATSGPRLTVTIDDRQREIDPADLLNPEVADALLEECEQVSEPVSRHSRRPSQAR